MLRAALAQVNAILRKELLDGLRDRRSLLSALLFPLLGPVLCAVLLSTMASSGSKSEPLELAVVGAENAPSLVDFLETQGVDLQEPPANPEAAVRDGELDVVLVIPPDYGEEFRAGRSATVRLVVDNSRKSSRSNISRSKKILSAWSSQLATLRLLARGVSPELLQPVAVEEIDLATPQKLAAALLDMITMFVILAAFFCNMYIAIDSTAGERERRSLEPLLINPVDRDMIVLGKWGATVLFGAAGVALTLVFTTIAMGYVPMEDLGVRVTLGPVVVFKILAVTLPLSMLAGAMQLLVASFARSFKEAQTYISLILFLPMMPGIAMSMNPMKTEDWMMLIPVLSQQLLVSDMMRGDPTSVTRHALAILATFVVSALFLWWTAKLFRRETIVFGR
jgi:sodium transport system permease protein